MDDPQPSDHSVRRRWWQRGEPVETAPSALRLAAEERGWPVTEDDPGLRSILEQAPLRLSAEHRAGTVAHGRVGSWESLSFEVIYDDSGRVSRPQFAVSAVPVPIPLPIVRVAPRRFLTHKAGALLVLPTGDEAFDARWQILASHDSADVRGLTADPLRVALMASPDLDELWTAAGHLAVSRVDGYHDALLREHATLLAAAMAGLQRSL